MPKICLVSSCGGHLTELRALLPALTGYELRFVLNDRIELPNELVGRTHFITHSERDLRTITNLFEAVRILRSERPDLILSTGAGPAVPFAIVGKFLGIPSIFVETVARIHKPSLTGRLMYYLADVFIYQWPGLRRFFRRGIYGGHLFSSLT